MLRPYQTEALASVVSAYDAGINRQLIAAATGTGKTIIFANLIEAMQDRIPGQTWVLAHREELVDQNIEKIRHWNPTLLVDKEMAEHEANPFADVIVSCIASIGRKDTKRAARFDWDAVTKVVIDEAHHTPASTYMNFLQLCGFVREIEENKDGKISKKLVKTDTKKLLLGVTATPQRGDGKALAEVYDKIVYSYPIREAIEDGWLVDLRGYRVHSTVNLDQVHTDTGDFKTEELSSAVNNEVRNKLVVNGWLSHGENKQTVSFCVDIQHSLDLAETFRSCGVKAYAIWGSDPDRAEKLRAHKAGEFQVLCNCGVLCLDLETEILTDEGWKKWNQVTMEHKVANWNFDGTVFFEEPKEIVVRPLGILENMVSIDTPRTSIRVTNTHRMIVGCGERNKAWKKIAAQQLKAGHVLPTCGRAKPVIFERPTNPSQYSRRRVSANAFNLRRLKGIGWEESFTEANKRESLRNCLTTKAPHELSTDECRLIGFWIADGSKSDHKIRGGIEYTLTQSIVYPNIIKWVDSLLSRLKIHTVRKDNSHYDTPHIRWSLCRGTGGGELARKGIYHLEPYLCKNGTSLFWGLSEEQFDSLVEGYWYGDGFHGDASKGFPSNPSFRDTKKPWIELLSAVGSVRGWRCSCSPPILTRKDNHSVQYGLRMIKDGKYHISSETKIKQDHTTEDVWCVKTTSRNIITRRHGKVIVMGNTEGYDDWRIGCIVLARPTKSGTLYTQMVGRGTRLQDGTGNLLEAIAKGTELEKTECILIDVCDQTSRHKLQSAPSLLGMAINFDLNGQLAVQSVKKLEAAQAANPHIDFSKLDDITKLKTYIERVNLWEDREVPQEIQAASKLDWHKRPDGSYMLILRSEENGYFYRGSNRVVLYKQKTIYVKENILGKFEIISEERCPGNPKQPTQITILSKAETNSLEDAFRAVDNAVSKAGQDKYLTRGIQGSGPATDKQRMAVAGYYKKQLNSIPFCVCLARPAGTVCTLCKKNNTLSSAQASNLIRQAQANKRKNL